MGVKKNGGTIWEGGARKMWFKIRISCAGGVRPGKRGGGVKRRRKGAAYLGTSSGEEKTGMHGHGGGIHPGEIGVGTGDPR